MGKEIVPIVYSTDENYVFITAVSIYSLLRNSKCKEAYNICIIIDDSVSDKSMKLLKKVEQYDKCCNIVFKRIDDEYFKNAEIKSQYLTKATLYRLLLPWLMPEYKKCIYLDGDTLILDDISGLLNWEMTENYLAGALDLGIDKGGYWAHILEIENTNSYVNAGVLVMNLEALRIADLRETFLTAVCLGYPLADQDILNKYCYGKIEIIPQHYNHFSIYRSYPNPLYILHYSGGSDVRPWFNLHSKDVQLWWSYADFFSDSEYFVIAKKKAEEYMRQRDYQEIWKKCSQANRIYIWGYTKRSRRLCDALRLSFSVQKIFFVDSDKEKQGQVYEDVKVVAPVEVEDGENTLFINTVLRRMDEVTAELVERGVALNDIVVFCEKDKGYYQVLDEKFNKKEFEDLILFTYGLSII